MKEEKQRVFADRVADCVAIILIIAAIAIPNLLRARISANESSAVASLRTLNTAQISYDSAFPTVGFATPSAHSVEPVARRREARTRATSTRRWHPAPRADIRSS